MASKQQFFDCKEFQDIVSEIDEFYSLASDIDVELNEQQMAELREEQKSESGSNFNQESVRSMRKSQNIGQYLGVNVNIGPQFKPVIPDFDETTKQLQQQCSKKVNFFQCGIKDTLKNNLRKRSNTVLRMPQMNSNYKNIPKSFQKKERSTTITQNIISNSETKQEGKQVIVEIDEPKQQNQKQIQQPQLFKPQQQNTQQSVEVDEQVPIHKSLSISTFKLQRRDINQQQQDVVTKKENQNIAITNYNQNNQKIKNKEKSQQLFYQATKSLNNAQQRINEEKGHNSTSTKTTKTDRQKSQKFSIPVIRVLQQLETIIGTCYFSTQKNPEPTKFKYEINLNQIIINNNLTIAFSSIIKIKMINIHAQMYTLQINYGVGKASAIKSNGKKVKTNKIQLKIQTVYIEECYQLIFTIFSALVTRRIILAQICRETYRNSIASQKKQIQKKQQQNILLTSTNMAVTSYLLGQSSNNLSHLQIPIESFPQDWSQRPLGERYSTSGMIMKKSQHLKKWQKRFIQIFNGQLFSYKSDIRNIFQNKGKNFLPKQPTIVISQVQQVSTKFQKFSTLQTTYLVIKIHHGKQGKEKTDLAIPVANYSDIFIENNWLLGLFTLMKND